MAKSGGTRSANKIQTEKDSTVKNGGNGGQASKTKYLKGTRKAEDSDERAQASPHITAGPSTEQKEQVRRQLESDLNKREVGLIEREIKALRLQEEVDRLRPLSGLYR